MSAQPVQFEPTIPVRFCLWCPMLQPLTPAGICIRCGRPPVPAPWPFDREP